MQELWLYFQTNLFSAVFSGVGLTFQAQGSNKKSVLLDLNHELGKELFLRLVEIADVVVVNYRSVPVSELAMRQRNAKLIFCHLTGYGNEEEAAYDNTIQAASGIIAQCKKKGRSYFCFFTFYCSCPRLDE